MAGAAALACCLVWDDLGQVRWAGLEHNHGTAEDVPGLLRACAGRDAKAAAVAADKLDDVLYHQGGWVCPAASAALPFLARLAADPQVSVRVPVLELIASIAELVPRVSPQWVDPGWASALEAAGPALLSLLDDADPVMRRAAAYLAGAGALAPGLVIPALRARSRAEPDRAARWDAVISLGAAAAGSAAQATSGTS